MKSVYSAVRTGSLNKAVCASSLKVKKKCQGTKLKITPPIPLLYENGQPTRQDFDNKKPFDL